LSDSLQLDVFGGNGNENEREYLNVSLSPSTYMRDAVEKLIGRLIISK